MTVTPEHHVSCFSLQLTWLPQEVESSDFILVTNLHQYNNEKGKGNESHKKTISYTIQWGANPTLCDAKIMQIFNEQDHPEIVYETFLNIEILPMKNMDQKLLCAFLLPSCYQGMCQCLLFTTLAPLIYVNINKTMHACMRRHNMETLSALLAICEGIHWSPMDSHHEGPTIFPLCFPEQSAVQTAQLSVIWDIMCPYDVTVYVFMGLCVLDLGPWQSNLQPSWLKMLKWQKSVVLLSNFLCSHV